MNTLHMRRNRLLKMAAILTSAFLFSISFYLTFVPSFCPDELVDVKLSRYIRGNFKLPVSSSRGPVRRVHFMHQTHLVLPDYRRFVSSWRQTYPNYELYFWTDSDIHRLVANRYPKLLGFYKNHLVNPLERSDFARILILHAYGGWYADLDAGCQRSAENVTARHSLIVPLEPYLHAMVVFKRKRLVNNAVMYSYPGHPFWLYYLHRIASEIVKLQPVRTKDDAVFSTGPVTMTSAVDQFLAAFTERCGPYVVGRNDDAARDPADFWCPYVPDPGRYSPLIDNSSYWLPTWARILCLTVAGQPAIETECGRMQRDGFANHLPVDAFTYHSFLHLTGMRDHDARENVSSWDLGIRISPMSHLS